MSDNTVRDEDEILEDLEEAEAEAEANDDAEQEESVQDDLQVMQDRLLRTMAEMENLRRRTEKELQESRKYALARFATDLLDIMDNMKRAEDAVSDDMATGNEALKNLRDGVTMTRNEMRKIFDQHGIKRIDPVGEPFDHNLHQAVTEVPTNEHKPGTVIDMAQAGYSLHDRLLRPALVVVAKAAPEAAEDAPSDDADDSTAE